MFHIISLLLGFTLLGSGIAISDLKDKPTKTESVSINISTVVKANLPSDQNKLNNFLDYASKKEQEIQTKQQDEEKLKKEEEEKAKIAEEKLKQGELAKIAAKKKADQEAKAKSDAETRKKALELSAITSNPSVSTSGDGDFNSYIQKICSQYGCNPSQLTRVMHCESGGRANATNGIHIGLFQFNPNTFANNAKKIGLGTGNIWDPYQQIQVAGWMFANGQASQWVCK